MTLFKEDDVFGYKDANEIKKFWASVSEPDPTCALEDIFCSTCFPNTGEGHKREAEHPP